MSQAKTAAALDFMKRHVGMDEHPDKSNRPWMDPERRWLWEYVHKASFQGQPWCAAAVTAAYLSVGIDLRNLCAQRNSFYCPNLVDMAKSLGAWRQESGPGFIVMYGNRGGRSSHTGISAPAPGARYYAYEGNTSSGASGSQTNGGGLYYRGRPRSWIQGWVDMNVVIDHLAARGKVVHPPAPGPATSVPAAPGGMGPFPLPSGHWFFTESSEPRVHSGAWAQDRAAVMRIQHKVGVTADGRYGPVTKAAVADYQRREGLVIDGAVGPTTWARMAAR